MEQNMPKMYVFVFCISTRSVKYFEPISHKPIPGVDKNLIANLIKAFSILPDDLLCMELNDYKSFN